MNHQPHQEPMTRRAMLRTAGLGILGGALSGTSASVAADVASVPAPTPDRASHNRFPRMVQEFYVARIREAERQADGRRARLVSKEDALGYIAEVRRKIQRCLGPWPERTPLQPRITGALHRDAYSVEKLIFESRPGFLVTANLYVPNGRAQPMPAVVGACGHYPEAKAAAPYQSFAQALARFGYVVLIFDPLGQGERQQYPDERLQSRVGDSLDEHLHAGNQQVLVGESLAAWRTWDGIRALDYLLTRPEVDPARVGVTGNSGGGTDATWLCGADPRWAMAAPECFVTTFRRNLENELPADPEQCPPRALALGLDHSDFIAAMAPRPVALIGQEKDFFDARGLETAYQRLRHLYGLLGAEDNITLVIEGDYHSYSQPSREAMYRWFNRVTGIAAGFREPSLTLETPEALQCTPRGQVSELGSRAVCWFTQQKSVALRQSRRVLADDELREAVKQALKLPPAAGVPDFRILRPERTKPYLDRHAGIYAVETEPGICAIVYRLSDEPLVSRPPRGPRRALLYICHLSSDEELRTDSWLAGMIAAETVAIYTCDPRGIGESRPNTCGKPFATAYGSDYFYAAHGIMFDYPAVGQKTLDVLQVLRWMRSLGHEDIHVVAAGWGTPAATFASLLADNVTQVTLRHAPTSYADIAESMLYDWPLSTFVPGVLEVFDLPDCYRALESKGLRLIEPLGPRHGETRI